MTNQRFSVRELTSIIVLSIFIIAISVPLGDASARSSRRMQNSTQLRGVHQGLVTYANSNKNWFAGIDKQGNDAGVTIQERYKILLDGDYFTPDYAISPFETASNIIEYAGNGPVVEQNYSFAMLQLPSAGARRQEWKQTLNSKSIVMSDRNTGSATKTFGYHNDRWESSSAFGCSYNHRQPYLKIGHWVGNVLWNDNHVAFEPTDTLPTDYDSVANPADNFFRTPGVDDALLIHTGN